jgi:hypothetical protein
LTRPRSRLWLGLAALAAAVAAALGCGSARTIGGTPPSAQEILARKCGFAPCHGGSAPVLEMNLSLGQAIASTVNVDSMEVPELKRVLPGDSANSYLYQKITQDPPAVGARMPVGDTLTADEIETIRLWIDGGARP